VIANIRVSNLERSILPYFKVKQAYTEGTMTSKAQKRTIAMLITSFCQLNSHTPLSAKKGKIFILIYLSFFYMQGIDI